MLLHDDAASGRRYFLALAAPPAQAAGQSVPRQVALLVDHSGSMEGAKREAADWAVKGFLAGLSAQDEFSLGLFHNTMRWLQPPLNPGDAPSVEKAVAFLERHRDSGGTELGVALEQALAIPRGRALRSRHVLIVTDAEVTDAGRILRLAEEEGEREDRRRISVLCIDAAPNSFLARETAERGGGVARFLSSNPSEEDITTALDEVLADWAQPVLAGLRLEVDRPTVLAAGRQVQSGYAPGWAQVDLGDLPRGRTVWVAGRVPKGEAATLRFRLTSGSQEVAAGSLDLARQAQRPALKALFGAWRILNLEFLVHSAYGQKDLADQLKRLGYDPDEALTEPGERPRVYAENARRDAEKALRGLLTREALDCGLASSETAFIAVRKEKGQVVEETVAVANALPAGWSEEFLGSQVMYSARPATLGLGPAAAAPSGRIARSARFTGARSLLADSSARLPAFPRRPTTDAARPEAEEESVAAASHTVVFAGVPAFQGREAVLFDSDRSEDAKKLPGGGTLSRIEVRFAGRAPKPDSLDPGLALLIFVDDLSSPRARVRLADLLRQGGQRPLNIACGAGQRVRIILADATGAWAGKAPQIEVALSF